MSKLETELLDNLHILIKKNGLNIQKDAQIKLVKYILFLNKWNKTYNLTSIHDPFEMLKVHILDSIAVIPYLQGKYFIDVGTGPGLPGIPLAICCPDKHFVLLDSLGKRIRFLRYVIHQLNLNSVTTIESRIEKYQTNILFDGVLTRAFSSLHNMLELTQHIIDKQGTFYAFKSSISEIELQKIPKKFQIQDIIQLNILDFNVVRNLIRIKYK